MDSARVNRLAFTKLTTINVVADEDCITAVIKKPVNNAKIRFDVIVVPSERRWPIVIVIVVRQAASSTEFRASALAIGMLAT